MSTDGVRPFRRSDRDQLAQLVNAHAQAVVPGMAISVNAIMSQLEGEPGEFIVEPWVTDRLALVAEQRGRITAAAFLVRYGSDERVGPGLRGTGEIRWLLFWPDAPFWPGSAGTGRAVGEVALATMHRWGVSAVRVDGSLPCPGVYGLPEQWPHVRDLVEQLGFRRGERHETVLLGLVDDLRRRPDPAFRIDRTLGTTGTRLTARTGDEIVGYIEVDAGIAGVGRISGSWADVGDLVVSDGRRQAEIGRFLIAEAAEWLHYGRIGCCWPTPPPTTSSCWICWRRPGSCGSR
jgi:hypothetical protein